MKEFVNVVKCECTSMCRKMPEPSILHSGTTCKDFKWPLLLKELSLKAPTLLAILKAATGYDNTSQKCSIKLGVAASLLYSRSKQLCFVQTLIVAVLYAGHAAKKVRIH